MVAGAEAGRHAAEVAVMLPEGSIEETVFGEAVATTEHREKEKGVLERNLNGINFLLIVLGILCTTFMVYQGGAMLGPGAAAPTLGLIVCLYRSTSTHLLLTSPPPHLLLTPSSPVLSPVLPTLSGSSVLLKQAAS